MHPTPGVAVSTATAAAAATLRTAPPPCADASAPSGGPTGVRRCVGALVLRSRDGGGAYAGARGRVRGLVKSDVQVKEHGHREVAPGHLEESGGDGGRGVCGGDKRVRCAGGALELVCYLSAAPAGPVSQPLPRDHRPRASSLRQPAAPARRTWPPPRFFVAAACSARAENPASSTTGIRKEQR